MTLTEAMNEAIEKSAEKVVKSRNWKFYVEEEIGGGQWEALHESTSTADARDWIKDAELGDKSHVRAVIVTYDVVVKVENVETRKFSVPENIKVAK